MVLIQRFCVIFSIRLGSIIIGSSSFIGNLAPFILLILWVRIPVDETHEFIKSRVEDKNTMLIKDVIAAVDKDPGLYSQLGLSASVAYSTSCLLEIYGAYTCKEIYLLPFLVLTLILYISFIGLHVIAMMLLKDNSQDLGLLIGATLFGSFLLLFMFYCLACVYSLWQVLRKPELRELAEDTIGIESNNKGTNANGMFVVKPRHVPNLRDDLRYTRRSPYLPNTNAIPTVSRFYRDGGPGPSGMTFTQEEITIRRPHYTSRPVPGQAFPPGYPSTSGYGALISPVY